MKYRLELHRNNVDKTPTQTDLPITTQKKDDYDHNINQCNISYIKSPLGTIKGERVRGDE